MSGHFSIFQSTLCPPHSPDHGKNPDTIKKNMTPIDQQSAEGVKGAPFFISGAEYAGVPQKVMPPVCFANPKSFQ